MAFRLFLGWLCGGFEFASCRLGVGLVSALHRLRVGFVLVSCRLCVGFVSDLCRFSSVFNRLCVVFLSALCRLFAGLVSVLPLGVGFMVVVGFVWALCRLCVSFASALLGEIWGQC